MTFYLLVLLSYLLGSIPFGYLIARLHKIDIQKTGSGSTGATNVTRALGLKWGIVVVLLDALKAALPLYLAFTFLTLEWQIAIIAIIPVLGHIFPVWLKFKGGKGVATFVPAFFIFLGPITFILLVVLWTILLKTTKTMSLVNLEMIFFIPFLFWFHTHSLAYFLLGVVFFLIILWTHRENIYRLYNQKELKL